MLDSLAFSVRKTPLPHRLFSTSKLMAAITLMLEIVNPRRVLTIGRIALCCPPGWKSQCQGDLLTTFSCPAGLRYECQYRLIRRLSGLIAEGNHLPV